MLCQPSHGLLLQLQGTTELIILPWAEVRKICPYPDGAPRSTIYHQYVPADKGDRVAAENRPVARRSLSACQGQAPADASIP